MKIKLRSAVLAAVMAVMATGATTAQAHHANATKTKVTGGQTTVTLSDATKAALTGAGITVSPLAPATAGADGLTFPIARGRINTTTLFGFISHRGGVSFTKGDNTAKLRHPVIVNDRHGASVWALALNRYPARSLHRRRGARASHLRGARWHWRWHAVKVLKLSNLHRSDESGKIVVTADAALTKRAARYLNRKLGTTLFGPGPIGTTTTTVTT